MNDDLRADCELVAEKLLGWERSDCNDTSHTHRHSKNCPRGWIANDGEGTSTFWEDVGYVITGNGSVKIIEEMRKRQYTSGYTFFADDAIIWFWFFKEQDYMAEDSDLRIAVVRAAAAALRDEEWPSSRRPSAPTAAC